MADPLTALAFDLWSMKLYWVAVSTLWVYDYFLTLENEIKFAWKGQKTPLFWMFILNRYLAPCFIIITLVAYFLPAFDLEACNRYGLMETLETMLLTFTAETFLTLRAYALLKRRQLVLVLFGAIIALQWAIVIYAMSQSSRGSNNPALLASHADPSHLPLLPLRDPFHICIFIATLEVTPWVTAFLCLSLGFDCLIFMIILYVTYKSTRQHYLLNLMRVIQRDGFVYFFVLLSSNLVWLLLLLHARPSLKFMHNQPAMIISSIMINRITLNLKAASTKRFVVAWGVNTFRPQEPVENDVENDAGIALHRMRLGYCTPHP